MKDIDFLPDGYRQQHSGRNMRLWRVVVVVGFVALLSSATLVQYYRLCSARNYLQQVTDQHTIAKNQNDQLAQVQSELKRTSVDADLFVYLRHPWPRTQILAALLAPLPDSVMLTQLEIKVETSHGFLRGQAVRRRKSDESSDQSASKLPAEHDLEWFREELDSSPVFVVMTGQTADPASLHRYLGKLDRCDLFVKAELDSLKSLGNKDLPEGTMAFTATVVVRPGYGQPGGPTGSTHVAQDAATRR